MIRLDKKDTLRDGCRLKYVAHKRLRKPNWVECSVSAVYGMPAGSGGVESAAAAFESLSAKYVAEDTGGWVKPHRVIERKRSVCLDTGEASFFVTVEVEEPWCDEPLVVNG